MIYYTPPRYVSLLSLLSPAPSPTGPFFSSFLSSVPAECNVHAPSPLNLSPTHPTGVYERARAVHHRRGAPVLSSPGSQGHSLLPEGDAVSERRCRLGEGASGSRWLDQNLWLAFRDSDDICFSSCSLVFIRVFSLGFFSLSLSLSLTKNDLLLCINRCLYQL